MKNYESDFHPGLIGSHDLDSDHFAGEVIPPIFQTSIFSHKTVEGLRRVINDEISGLMYTRGNNPTLRTVEKKLAALEKAEEARLFASGVAAMSAAVLSNVKSGDHVICVDSAYSWTRHLVKDFLPRFGLEYTFIQGDGSEEITKTLKPNTRLIILESPSSIVFRMQDLEAVAALARSRDIITVIDNTWSTPLFQNPIEWGIDLVVHSASKYLSGHSDVVAGAVMGSSAMMKKIFFSQLCALGGIISPMNAWLILRGLRTLEIRMKAHWQNTMQVVSFLESHSAVESVIYPGHQSYRQKELAEKYLSGSSGLMSFTLKDKRRTAIEAFVHSLSIPHISISWGGFESLIFPLCASNPHPPDKLEGDAALIRMHVGLEPVNLLLGDLDQALDKNQ